MALFQPFKKATGSVTPDFSGATAKQGELEQRAKMRENALRSQNTIGVAELYNAGMGDRTPIADYMFGGKEPTPGIEAVPSTGVAAPTATYSGGAAGGMAGANAAEMAAASEMAGAGGAITGTGAAGAGAGGSGALAAMGPVGWAALAALALSYL